MTALAAPGTPVLAVDDVHVHAGDTPIVNGVSFALAPGERVGLIGRARANR
jgi:ATPase subunit of ABC transporter with duplicated ATPase domains